MRALRTQDVAVAAAILAGALLIGLLGGLGVHHDCLHAPPPVDLPDPGTPRANFCDTANTAQPWSQALVTMLLATPLLALRNPFARFIWITALAAANIIVVVIVSNLDSALTI